MQWKKKKVAEVLSLDCLDREPREGYPHNRWIAHVRIEAKSCTILRTVTLMAKDGLEAYTKLLTEGV